VARGHLKSTFFFIKLELAILHGIYFSKTKNSTYSSHRRAIFGIWWGMSHISSHDHNWSAEELGSAKIFKVENNFL